MHHLESIMTTTHTWLPPTRDYHPVGRDGRRGNCSSCPTQHPTAPLYQGRGDSLLCYTRPGNAIPASLTVVGNSVLKHNWVIVFSDCLLPGDMWGGVSGRAIFTVGTVYRWPGQVAYAAQQGGQVDGLLSAQISLLGLHHGFANFMNW